MLSNTDIQSSLEICLTKQHCVETQVLVSVMCDLKKWFCCFSCFCNMQFWISLGHEQGVTSLHDQERKKSYFKFPTIDDLIHLET